MIIQIRSSILITFAQIIFMSKTKPKALQNSNLTKEIQIILSNLRNMA